jgi:hypothetical protein
MRLVIMPVFNPAMRASVMPVPSCALNPFASMMFALWMP